MEPAQVNWMEWPAEVSVATPFTTRLVGWGVSCVEVLRFVTTPTLDQSAVTFEPYYLVGKPQFCPLDAARQDRASAPSLIVAPFYDTQVNVPGLEAQYPRTYEIRAGTNVSASGLASALPIRTFGEITVRTAQVESGRINAGGTAYMMRDSVGCVSLHPYGVYPGYVIENPPPPDTVPSWTWFVRGYIYDAPSPVCGESKVFHLVTRE